MDDKVQEILDTLSPDSLRVDAGRFAPKLNFDERCAVLASYLSGVNRRLIAIAFGINRRTVTHVYNTQSPHYKDVREEYEKLGREEFLRKYMTEHVATKLKESEQQKQTQIVMGLSDREESALANKLARPNPRRNKDEGLHRLKPEQCAYSHRVQIMWADGHFGDGWYFKDLDGPFPDQWSHSGKDSILSSTTALTGANIEIMDK